MSKNFFRYRHIGHSIRILGTVVGILTLLTLVDSGAVGASVTAQVPAITSPSTGVAQGAVVDTAMHIAGFDAAVARAHGFRIVMRNGVWMSVSSAHLSSGPLNTVGGDCGKSWIYLTGTHLEYHYYTGFSVNTPAVEYGWQVSIVGPYSYDNNRTWGGGLLFRTTWRAPGSGDYNVPVDDSGYYDGKVIPSGSWALLDNGGYCVSGGPSSRTYVP
jgi:hypothetical protein